MLLDEKGISFSYDVYIWMLCMQVSRKKFCRTYPSRIFLHKYMYRVEALLKFFGTQAQGTHMAVQNYWNLLETFTRPQGIKSNSSY